MTKDEVQKIAEVMVHGTESAKDVMRKRISGMTRVQKIWLNDAMCLLEQQKKV